MLPFMSVRVTGAAFYGCEGDRCCFLGETNFWSHITQLDGMGCHD